MLSIKSIIKCQIDIVYFSQDQEDSNTLKVHELDILYKVIKLFKNSIIDDSKPTPISNVPKIYIFKIKNCVRIVQDFHALVLGHWFVLVLGILVLRTYLKN